MRERIKVVLNVLCVIAVIVALAVMLVISEQQTRATLGDTCHVELLMPGNTLVTGDCDKIYRLNNGWMKCHINGKWYAANEWRIVLMEGKEL